MAMEMSEEMVGTIMPVVLYWVVASVYELLSYFLENNRLHPKGEELTKNIASRSTVVKVVLLNQAFQVVVMYASMKWMSNSGDCVPPPQPSLPVMAWQFLIGMVVIDTWQYFGHRYQHVNKFLYKHVHATHHALVVPYAWGALYSHLVDSFILDTVGSALALLASGMTPRTSIYFFAFVTVKAIDLHAGMYLPWNPLQAFFTNNAAFHDVHHQLRGNKHNFAVPFFVAWDKILGTYMPFTVEERKGGGFEVVPVKN